MNFRNGTGEAPALQLVQGEVNLQEQMDDIEMIHGEMNSDVIMHDELVNVDLMYSVPLQDGESVPLSKVKEDVQAQLEIEDEEQKEVKKTEFLRDQFLWIDSKQDPDIKVYGIINIWLANLDICGTKTAYHGYISSVYFVCNNYVLRKISFILLN